MSDISAPIVRAEEDKVLPAVVYGLYLLAFPTCALSAVVGLIIAYANRAVAGPINASHYVFAIRSFWMTIAWFLIGLVIFIVALPWSLVLVGIPMLIVGAMIMGATGLWFALRCAVGIYYLARGEAHPRPLTWLV